METKPYKASLASAIMFLQSDYEPLGFFKWHCVINESCELGVAVLEKFNNLNNNGK